MLSGEAQKLFWLVIGVEFGSELLRMMHNALLYAESDIVLSNQENTWRATVLVATVFTVELWVSV